MFPSSGGRINANQLKYKEKQLSLFDKLIFGHIF
jgi:hypothetical protein